MDGCGCLNSGVSSDTAVRRLEHQENEKCNPKLNKKVLQIPHLRTLCGISLMDPFNSVNKIVCTIRNCILIKSREQVGSRCMEFWGFCQEYFVQLYSFPDTLLWIFSQLFLLSSYLHESCMTWPWFCITFKEHFTLFFVRVIIIHHGSLLLLLTERTQIRQQIHYKSQILE